MQEEFTYVTKHELRQLGFTQPDSEVIPLLDKINQIIAEGIDQEIPKEIAQNYNPNLLSQYLQLRENNDFASSIVQDWLQKNIKSLNSITTDNKEFVLHKIRVRMKKRENN